MLRTRVISFYNNIRNVSTTSYLMKGDDRRAMLKSMPKKDEGSQGENTLEFDIAGPKKVCGFPRLDTPQRLFDNIPYEKLPIIYVRSTRNNTLFNLTTHDGQQLISRSCGVDGFKNCRKGTNIAAQVTAAAFGRSIVKAGYKTCRVCIEGLGAGRMSSFRGMQLAGINIVSITDITPIYDYPKNRPPAARSL